jgi:hypothetical protein
VGWKKHTFNQLAAKDLARRQLQRAHMTLRLVQEFDGNSDAAHCAVFLLAGSGRNGVVLSWWSVVVGELKVVGGSLRVSARSVGTTLAPVL